MFPKLPDPQAGSNPQSPTPDCSMGLWKCPPFFPSPARAISYAELLPSLTQARQTSALIPHPSLILLCTQDTNLNKWTQV